MLLGVPLVLAFGGIGYALANAGVLATNLLLFRVARTRLQFHVLPATVPVWMWAATVGVLEDMAERAYPCTSLVRLTGRISPPAGYSTSPA